MANITKTLADTAGFIPQAWATEALNVLRQNVAVVKTIARDTDFESPGWKGKSLTVPYPGVFSASDKTAGSVATVSTPTGGSSVTLNLTAHKTVDFILEDVPFNEATAGISMMSSYGEAAGIALAEQIETDLLAAMVNGSGGGLVGTVGTDLTKTQFFSARKALQDNKAPRAGRAFVMSTKDAASLLQDSTMQNYFAFNANARDDWQEGMIGRFAGFDLYESQFVGTNAAGHALQTITLSGGITGGTFTITYEAQTTSALAYNASAATVQAALAALSTLGSTVTVDGAGGNNGVYYIYIPNNLDSTPSAFTVNVGSLTGGTPAATIADAPINYRNVAYHKNALMVAFRQLQTPVTAGVEVAYASDPDTGVTLRILMQYQPTYRGVYVAYDVLYGYVNLRPSQGVIVIS